MRPEKTRYQLFHRRAVEQGRGPLIFYLLKGQSLVQVEIKRGLKTKQLSEWSVFYEDRADGKISRQPETDN